MAPRILDTLSFEEVKVLPLRSNTAERSLFRRDYPVLQHPSFSSKAKAETVVVWEGVNSVGSNVVQLAVAVGYEAFTTAKPINFNHVKKSGAAVFDYWGPSIVQHLPSALKRKESAGPIISAKTVGDTRLALLNKGEDNTFAAMVGFLPVEKILHGVETGPIFGTSPKNNNEISRAMWIDSLGPTLSASQYSAAPEAEGVDDGLNYIQEGSEKHREGVSAGKAAVGS